MGSANPANAPDFEKHIRDRVRLFEGFEPRNYIRGQGGFGSYFGAQFADDLVVFENLKYGNAVYLLYQDWNEAAQRSRFELLRDQDAHFDRVVHKKGWEDQLTALLHDKLFERGLRRRRSGYRSRRGRRGPSPYRLLVKRSRTSGIRALSMISRLPPRVHFEDRFAGEHGRARLATYPYSAPGRGTSSCPVGVVA